MNIYKFITLQNCLGVLDDTYIKVNVSVTDHLRYKTWNDEVAANVLGVCDMKGDFVFILVGVVDVMHQQQRKSSLTWNILLHWMILKECSSCWTVNEQSYNGSHNPIQVQV